MDQNGPTDRPTAPPLPQNSNKSNEKTLQTLPEDIYALFNPEVDHVVDEENLELFTNSLKDLIRARLRKPPKREGTLRFSNLGKRDRQVWYDAHPDGTAEKLTPKTYFKFLYGDVIEQLLLLLVREAGHKVELEQHEVEVDGVLGHIDAKIDGVIVDIKSAAPMSFQKFKNGSIIEGEDPFGYVQQLSGYSSCLEPEKDAAWVVMDKVDGSVCVSSLPLKVIKENLPESRIKRLKEVIASDSPPERCYSPTPDGKSGNMKLPPGCSYCSHKFRCWPNVRTFIYSTGPRYLTEVIREPDVPEITGFTEEEVA